MAEGRVPLLDPETGLLPDAYLPQAAIDAVAAAVNARNAAVESRNQAEVFRQEAQAASGTSQQFSQAAQEAATQAQAVGNTNDSIMSGVLRNTASEFYGEVNNILSPIRPDGGVRAVGKGELTWNILDFTTSFFGLGSGNDTYVFQAANDKAAEKGGRVLVPCGTWRVEGLIISSFVVFFGMGKGSRFSPSNLPGGSRAVSRLVRPGVVTGNASTETMVTCAGAASGLENISLEGLRAPGTILVMQGFETVLDNVRCIAGGGIGLDVQKANNVKWGWLYIDNCGGGTVETPAVKIWSKAGVGSANETNTLEIVSLRIERSFGIDLAVADGTTAEHWVEWLKILFLHIETPRNEFETYAKTLPSLSIGNVRSVEILLFMIYGGTAELIRHNQRLERGFGNGEIRMGFGWLLGLDTDPTKIPGGQSTDPPLQGTTVAINLMAGKNFYMDRVVVRRILTQVVTVAAAYGRYGINLASSSVRLQPPPALVRNSTNVSAATILTGTAVGTDNSDDSSGRVFLTSTPSPTTGELVRVNFYHPDDQGITVNITPQSAAAALAQYYVGINTDANGKKTGFSIFAAVAPQPSQSLQFGYDIGRKMVTIAN